MRMIIIFLLLPFLGISQDGSFHVNEMLSANVNNIDSCENYTADIDITIKYRIVGDSITVTIEDNVMRNGEYYRSIFKSDTWEMDDYDFIVFNDDNYVIAIDTVFNTAMIVNDYIKDILYKNDSEKIKSIGSDRECY